MTHPKRIHYLLLLLATLVLIIVLPTTRKPAPSSTIDTHQKTVPTFLNSKDNTIATPFTTTPKKVHIRYRFTLSNQSQEVINNAQFSLFAPHNNQQGQTIIHYTISEPYQWITDEHHNQSITFKPLSIPPYGRQTITANMTIAKTPMDINLEKPDDYLHNSPYLNMDHPSVIQLAQQLNRANKHQTAQAIYLWLTNNVTHLNYVAKAQGAAYAIEHQKGDCTETMHAFIALARLNGIPARAMGGFVVEGNTGIIKAHAYHNWPEYHNGKRWIIADPNQRIFDQTGNKHYISFRYLDHLTAQQAFTQRFINSEEKIKVSMH